MPSESAPPAHIPAVAAVEAWSRRLKQLVAERATAEESAKSARSLATRTERKAYEEAVRQQESQGSLQEARLLEEIQQSESAALTSWNQQLRELDVSVQTAIQEVEDRYHSERAAAQSSRDETTWLVGSLLDEGAANSPRQQLQRLHAQMDGAEAILQEAIRRAETVRTNAADYLERCRLSTEVGLLEPAPPVNSLSALQDRCLEEVELVERPYQQLLRMWLPRCFAGITPVLLWLGMAVLLAGPAWWLLDPAWLKLNVPRTDVGWVSILAGSGAALSLVAMLMLHLTANQRAFDLITEVFVHSRAAQAHFARWQRLAAEELAAAQQDLDRRHQRQKQQRVTALSTADSEFRERTAELDHWRTTETNRLELSARMRRTQLELARDEQLTNLRTTNQRRLTEFTEQQTARREFLETHHVGRELEIEQEYTAAWLELSSRWHDGMSELQQQARNWQEFAERISPPWSHLETAVPASDFRGVILGTYDVDLQSLEHGVSTTPELQLEATRWKVPALVDLHEKAALVVQFRDAVGRQAAVQLLQAAMLRLLATLPPGQVRFTILDPLSLGENFATFMHLADVDELLVNTRIWTEPGQIEERLADLTEHMETVLQNFLRNEFATLEDYNREAGEVAEPYRVLVVSGLPHGFSDIALRRLWNIIMGGARCGVIPLVAVDQQMTMPRGFAWDDLQPYVSTVAWDRDVCRWQHPELKTWPLSIEFPPEGAQFGRLVKRFGQLAGDVRKVEVPFQRVAPTDAAVWTHSSAKKLEIPIGRAGASRTQSLVLGTGTSQHVLIAGKTGSGKSSLLHALITNAALHFSPEELELYLIDFKKGVEFKVYARHRLPHARVIGIESDREFGVSALERLDWELQDRSALFREAGVSDLAGFRRARPEHPLPRILLIIDEFQEFFVDDDSLAQTAALLFDRLIRQGRAFGVHVILGSQTLAGAYSLARSTLGQVAVRIALQCSETDAHLILSEENTAARLLTRPGEAIYNDANGLTTGNHLFQVVWLDDDVRDGYLEQIAARDAQTQHSPRPTIVFEGNLPADISTMPTPPKLGAEVTSRQGPTAWLGESVSLRGPLGLEFPASAGSHLLVVGQDEVSALGMLAAATLSIARHPASRDVQLFVVNGSPQAAAERVWTEIAAHHQHVRAIDQADLEQVLTELVDELRTRDGKPGPRRWLTLFDLARFRKLRRKDDDFGFGGFDKKAASPSDQLAEILRDGPGVGIHVCIWCDSTNTMTRWLSRDMQQQLEHRVALPMNASDSSLLIDSPVASRLGANRAWLYRGDRGTLDKFRPYSLPRTESPQRMEAPPETAQNAVAP